MITQDKVFIFQKYSGNSAKWAQTANVLERNVIDEGDWPLITEMLHELSSLKSGASEARRIDELKHKMEELVDCDPTRKLLIEIA